MYSMPVGLDNFREMIAREYYFVDKTNFIEGRFVLNICLGRILPNFVYFSRP